MEVDIEGLGLTKVDKILYQGTCHVIAVIVIVCGLFSSYHKTNAHSNLGRTLNK